MKLKKTMSSPKLRGHYIIVICLVWLFEPCGFTQNKKHGR